MRVVVALGKIGFDAWLQVLRRQGVRISPKPQFEHGVVVRFEERGMPSSGGGEVPILVGCYHPSRQNTNTGVLTAQMLANVFRRARALIRSHGLRLRAHGL